eukprot:m.252356 g.252356  ORF g.252356 m.252356 type:complete len:295 (+) comp19122_c0_seq13:605-1489(+)
MLIVTLQRVPWASGGYHRDAVCQGLAPATRRQGMPSIATHGGGGCCWWSSLKSWLGNCLAQVTTRQRCSYSSFQPLQIHRVVFCVFSERDEAIYQAMMGEFFPFSQSFGLASLMDSPKPGTGFVARTPFSKLFASVLPGAGGSRSTPSISTPLRMGHVKRTSAGQTPLRVGGKWSPIPEAAIDPPAIDPPAARGSCGSGSSALATAVVATTPMSASASASSPPLSQPVFDDVDMQDSPSPGANAHGCGSADNGGGGHFQQHHRASNGGRGQDTDSSFGDEADFDEEPPRRATWI